MSLECIAFNPLGTVGKFDPLTTTGNLTTIGFELEMSTSYRFVDYSPKRCGSDSDFRISLLGVNGTLNARERSGWE